MADPAAPSLSVIVASGAGGEFLFRCLASLQPQVRELSAELIVVDRVGGEQAARVEREYPSVRLVRVDGSDRPSIPELRKRGVLEAQGEVCCVLEEHCTAPAGWLQTALDAFAEVSGAAGEAPPLVAIGGPILDDGFDRVRDWVVYFSEYHNYLPPWPDEQRVALNGANIAYSRAALLRHEEALDQGYWEVVLHPLLAKDGSMRAVNAFGAHHTGPFDYGYYLEQRYLLSRVWGGTQRETASLTKRLVYSVAAPVFPLLLLLRIAARVRSRPRLLPRFVSALPLLVPVACAYVLGEWLGYLLGPGDALERVE